MDPTDPRAQPAFDAALAQLQATLDAAAERVATQLGALAASAMRINERDALNQAQMDLRRASAAYLRITCDALRDRVTAELQPRHDPARRLGGSDWQTLTLVDDDEVEERMFADRIAQAIAHSCDGELSEMATYTGSLLGIGRADSERNPLRPEVLGAAVYKGIVAVAREHDSRRLLAREMGTALSQVMAACYAGMIRDFKARGVAPVSLSLRAADGHEGTRDRGPHSRSDAAPPSQRDTAAGGSHFQTSAGGGEFGPSTGGRGSGTGSAGLTGTADAELMNLIRRLTFLASRPGELGAASTGGAFSGSTPLPAATAADGTGLMAVNLIHAHREELRQASTGTLDHMVIDVVGSLFDQILSDSRVPPQMARQIARLQLPVLRVALRDNSFFSSRKHPVRRFVNRIASLACAFDEFDQGAGRELLNQVRRLVQEIVDGDFDQLAVYESQLSALEQFIARQGRDEVQRASAAASVVDGKESELHVQQRYMQQLQSALAPLSLQIYLRDFLSQVWSQALMQGMRREGPKSERVGHLKRVARDLVLSVQPKGSPALRQKFLLQLPTLMKDLNEGLAVIGWPEPARKDFFAQLMPAHADSLKGQPLSELEYNLMAKELEAIFNQPVPEPEPLQRSSASLPGADAQAIEPNFSAEEARQIGLVDASAVDWDGQLDIDLSGAAADEPSEVGAEPSTQPAALTDSPAEIDIRLDLAPGLDLDLNLAGPAEPARGPQLIGHVKLGVAYEMNLAGEWQKVRLDYMSPGRAFFVFSRSKRHGETVSLTARMLSRMCEAGRFRALENSYLLERATARARKQLAALSAGRSRAAASSS